MTLVLLDKEKAHCKTSEFTRCQYITIFSIVFSRQFGEPFNGVVLSLIKQAELPLHWLDPSKMYFCSSSCNLSIMGNPILNSENVSNITFFCIMRFISIILADGVQ